MKKLIGLLLLNLILTGCAFMRESGEHRHLQTEILNKITSKNKQFASCARNSDIYKALGASRVRVVLSLNINKHGELEKFQLDDQSYPMEFSDCVFETLELISFPSNKLDKMIEVEQPFIFSKKL